MLSKECVMSETFTQGEFEDLCRGVHGDKYDYSYDTYKGMVIPYKVYCKDHGFFNIQPSSIIHGKQGCKKCYRDRVLAKNKVGHLSKLQKVHKGKYEIKDWLELTTLRHKVIVTCQDHGDYEEKLSSILNTDFGGCPKCKQLKEGKVFVEKAKGIHGSKYTYDENDYVCSRDSMKIWCNTHKEYFYQRPSAHLQGQNCPLCGKESTTSKLHKDVDHFITRARAVHGDKYDYSKSIYTTAHKKITITCPEHGDFRTTSNNHWAGLGCKECKDSERRELYLNNLLSYVGKQERYNHFDMSQVKYISNTTKVRITCTEHNEVFYATPNKLLDSSGVIGCKVCYSLNQNRWTLKGILNIPNIENKTGYFYLGKVSGLRGVKIGITGNIKERQSNYNTDLRKYEGFSFNYYDYIKTNYFTAAVIEVVLKKIYKKDRVKHDLNFGGKHEIFDPRDTRLIHDILSGRFDLELNYLSSIVTHNNDESLLNFVKTLREKYEL
jgi:hypothetical protein